MKDLDKSKEELLSELERLRLRFGGLETLETETHRVTEVFDEQKQLFRMILDTTPDILTLKDRKSIYRVVNRAFCKCIGRREEAILGKTDLDLFPADEAARCQQDDDRVMATGESYCRDAEVAGAGGGKQWFKITKTPVIDQTGIVVGVLCTVRDITERKQAEEALRESEEEYRMLAGNLPGFVYKGFMDWSVEFYDNRVELLTGYNMHEFNSRRMKWADLVLKEDIESSKKAFIGALKTDKAYVRDYRIKTRAGDIVWIQDRGQILFNGKGDIDYVSGVFFDITDHKEVERALRESEERYRNLYRESRQREQLYESLLSSTPDAVAIYNLDGETIYINPAFTRVFGFTMEDVQGRSIPFVPECEMESRKELIENVLGGESVSGFETKRLTKDGNQLDVSVSSSCYKDHEGNTAGVVMILRDVTGVKKIEKQLLHAQKMEAVGTLAGGVAHDFNNLLQAIQGYAELLVHRSAEGEPGHREYQQILRASKRGSELTRQLLTFSRKVESRKQPLNLNWEVRQTKKLLERTIPKMIEIELSLQEDLKIIHADSTQVEQVVMNIVINAKDAMPDGGRVVIGTENVTLDEGYCRLHLGSKPGDYALLTISDNGLGMDEETHEHIFEPFYTTKGTGKGTGLGLAMVYGIVKSHDGYITCYSKPGEGTAFKIYFPVIRQQRRSHEIGTETDVKGGSETILLVDDEDSVRDLVDQILSDFGYTVLLAEDGESALELYREKKDRIGLVILDLIMPGMGGKRCLEQILELNPHAKVLVASGYVADGASEETRKIGAKSVLRKPFTLQQILLEVRRILDER